MSSDTKKAKACDQCDTGDCGMESLSTADSAKGVRDADWVFAVDCYSLVPLARRLLPVD